MDKKLSTTDAAIGWAFSDDYGKEMSISEIARHTGLHHRTVSLRLERLEELGIFERRREGKMVFARPRISQRFKTFMVMSEAMKFLVDGRDETYHISERARGRFLIIFGSFARNEEHEWSDIDIVSDTKTELPLLEHEPQWFIYRKIRDISDGLFGQIAASHLIIRGHEEFVEEMVRRHVNK